MANERLYLSSASLGGYKSIKDASTTFDKGLNIIIGKNAAGKTNFLKFLYSQLIFNYDSLGNFESELNFQNKNYLTIQCKSELAKNILSNNSFAPSNEINPIFHINGIILTDEDQIKPHGKLRINEMAYSTTFIKHGLTDDLFFITKPFSIKIQKGEIDSEMYRILATPPFPHFAKNIIVDISVMGVTLKDDNFNIEYLTKKINNLLKSIEQLKQHLSLITPIQDIRFNKSLDISINEASNICSVNNLLLEFLIDDEWHLFDSLSDGTKRLFYIIADIAFPSRFYFGKNAISFTSNPDYRIVLIEEPELGIHPHQFQQLMRFLKEQSQNKQIIITTHSPQALDILNKDELNSIIIAYYEKAKGTCLRHLSNAEISKAQKYMSEDYLSDYWRFSDLERTKVEE